MINDLKFALMLNERRHTTEFVVSKEVLLQVLNHITGNPVQGSVRLNMRQSSFNYPFMHHVSWRGILFIHLSKEEFTRRMS